MSPGPIEETGKVATAVIESLKTNPAMLAILIFNVIVVVMVYFSAKEFRATNDRVINALLSQHSDMVQMISRCVVPTSPTL